MAQTSGPISQGTTGERQFSDVLWRDRFGDEPGVLGDYDGTSYKLTLPSDTTDVVSVGSSSQASLATVAGFVHKIAAGTPEPITIPDAVGTARTDIISLRYDPAYTGAPGPVRLFRIAGTSSAVPVYDAAPPGVEDLPLWSITRQPSQNLNLAAVVRMFPRIAPSMGLSVGSSLPTSSPLDTVIRQGNRTFRRALNSSLVPVWVESEASLGRLISTQLTTTGVVNVTDFTVIQSVTVTIPDGLDSARQIEVSGTVWASTPSGVGAGITINGGTARSTAGSQGGDLWAWRDDTSLTPGSRTYTMQLRCTVAGQSVTWRHPRMSVKIV